MKLTKALIALETYVSGLADLIIVERSGGAVFLDDRREHRAGRRGALAPRHRLAGIQAFDTQPDGSPMWWRQADPVAFHAYSFHEFSDARPFGAQIECLDRCLDKFVDPRVNLTVPFGPATMFRQECRQSALGLEAGSPTEYSAAIN